MIWVCDTSTLHYVYKRKDEHKCAACAARNRCRGPVKYARVDKESN